MICSQHNDIQGSDTAITHPSKLDSQTTLACDVVVSITSQYLGVSTTGVTYVTVSFGSDMTAFEPEQYTINT